MEGPTVVRRQLGRRLRALRESRGIVRLDPRVAEIASERKLKRIEAGQQGVRVADTIALCTLYEADPDEQRRLVALAQASNTRGWWESFAGQPIPDWFGLYIGLETSAARIDVYQPNVIHGLLQTEEYARALIRGGDPDLGPDEVENLVRLRIERQAKVIDRDEPALVSVLLEEGSFAMQVGGTDVMARQLAYLSHLDAEDHISVRVIPGSSGAHAILGAFTVLSFADPEDPDFVYAEGPLGARYGERVEEVQRCRATLSVLRGHSVPVKEYKR